MLQDVVPPDEANFPAAQTMQSSFVVEFELGFAFPAAQFVQEEASVPVAKRPASQEGNNADER